MSSENLLYEQRIKELERDLQNVTDKLSAFKKEYEEFLLIASHDLQAPLRKLITFADRLSNKFKELSEEEAKLFLTRIVYTAANMKSLIDNLSTLAAVTEEETGFEKCNLNEILENIIKHTEQNIAETEINISTSLPIIEGNCTYLKHLFQNVIENAVKFQKKDIALQINITTKELNSQAKATFDLDANKVYYTIEIADNGIGFDNEHSEKIFKPFQRLHGKSDYEGEGLGLAICKKIIEKHQGIIYADSHKNTGARFILILPETQR